MADIEIFSPRAAALYNLLVSLMLFHWVYATALSYVKKVAPPGARVLEIGPGVGQLMKMLANAGYDVVGVDASPPMLKYSRLRGRAVASLSSRLPVKETYFDAAIAVFTLNHWGDHATSLREVERALKPGGVFIAVEVDLSRVPLAGTHGCTPRCLADLLSPEFKTEVRRKFPLVVAVGKKTS